MNRNINKYGQHVKNLEAQIADLITERDELVATLQAALDNSSPAPAHYQDTREWVNKARAALAKVNK